jgi:DNA-directed RNA polymerase beta subunit
MEVWAMLEHDSTAALQEILTVKSDDAKARNDVLKNMIYSKEVHMPVKTKTRSSNIFKTSLNAIGLDLIEDGNNNNDTEDGRD